MAANHTEKSPVPLSKMRRLMHDNSVEAFKQYPELEQAAEAVSRALWMLTDRESHLELPSGDSTLEAAEGLAFGAHQSWMKAVLFASGGQVDSGFSEARRAAEYVCYAAKIVGSPKKLELWRNRSTSAAARSKFSGPFRLPHSYRASKYAFLRAVLVLHAEASESGAHANFTLLSSNFKKDAEGNGVIGYFAPRNRVIQPTVVLVVYGLRLLYALRTLFDASLRDVDELDEIINAAHERTTRVAGRLGNDMLAESASEFSETFDKLYQELLAREDLSPKPST